MFFMGIIKEKLLTDMMYRQELHLTNIVVLALFGMRVNMGYVVMYHVNMVSRCPPFLGDDQKHYFHLGMFDRHFWIHYLCFFVFECLIKDLIYFLRFFYMF